MKIEPQRQKCRNITRIMTPFLFDKGVASYTLGLGFNYYITLYFTKNNKIGEIIV